MSHTTTAVVGRRCEPASASWKVAWWPRPVSGSVSARSRREPSSSAVRRQAAPWVASCSSSSTSSVPMAAGSSEASTRAPSSSPWARRPTATSVSTPAARSSARLAAGAASGSPTVKSEIPSSTHAPIESSGAARRTSASGPAATDGLRAPPAPVVRASSTEPSGTRSRAALSSASATAAASCRSAMSATWRSRRCMPDSLGRPPSSSMRAPRARARLAQVLEVAVAQGLARLDVEHADGQAAGAHGEARLGHDPRVGLEVVLARADVLEDHLGPLAVRAPHDPGAAGQPVAGLPVAVQAGAPQASAAGEVDRGQEPLLARDVVDHRRRGGGGVRSSLERQAQQGGGQAHH